MRTSSAHRSRSRLRVVLIAFVALVAVLAGAYAVGYRLNLQTGSVPVPTATASPEDVVRVYTEAYDRRDFATMRAVYPSRQSAYSRFRAMGTMRNLQITRSRMVDKDPHATTRAGHSYYLVSVTLDLTGLTAPTRPSTKVRTGGPTSSSAAPPPSRGRSSTRATPDLDPR